jgi:hypothetical protein
MKKLIMITIGASLVLGFILGPPDFAARLTLGVESAILCALLVLPITRLKSFSTAQTNMKRIVFVLACLLSVLAVKWINLLIYSGRAI